MNKHEYWSVDPLHPHSRVFKVTFYEDKGERRVRVMHYGRERSWRLKENQTPSKKMAEIAVTWFTRAQADKPTPQEKYV